MEYLKFGQLMKTKKRLPREEPNKEMDMKTAIADFHRALAEAIFIACAEGKERNVPVTAFEDQCKQIICLDWPEELLNMVFRCLDFRDLVQKNEKDFDDILSLKKIQDAFAMLFRYGTNLLQPRISPNWRLISFNNVVYVMKVSSLKGHKAILKKYGYTKEMPYGLSYPDASHTPNIDTVKNIAADLAIAFFLIEFYIREPHQHGARIHTILLSKNTDCKEEASNPPSTDSLYSISTQEMSVNEGRLAPLVKAGPVHRTIDSGIGVDDVRINDSFMNEPNRLFGRTKNIGNLDSDEHRRITTENQVVRSPSSQKKIPVTAAVCEQSPGSRDFDDILKSIAKAVSDDGNSDGLYVALGLNPSPHTASFEETLKMLRDWRKKQFKSEEREALRQTLLKAGLGHLLKDLLPHRTFVKGDIALKTCGICKQKLANVGCNICSQPRCERCDELWHKHPQRQGHTRHLIIPEELEAPEVQQPAADISRRRPDPNAPQPVIDKTTMRETRLAGGSSPKTPGLFTLPEVSIEETSASSRANDLPDSPKLQHGLELKADVPVVICDLCSYKPGKKFCPSCDDTYCLECDEKRHNKPRRKDHIRQDVTQITQPGNTSNVETMGPDQEPLELSKDVPNTSTADTDNQEPDSMASTYYSVLGDTIYINSEEALDVRAPPNDTYRIPVEKTSLGSGAPKAQGYKSSDYLEESPYMLVPALRDGARAPQNTSGGTNDSKLQAKQDEITAEDIAIMETLISVRDLKKHETDPAKRAKLDQEEQLLNRKHEGLMKRLEELQGRQSGMPGASRQDAAVASPPKGAAVPTGAGMAVPQGKVLSPATSAGTMSASINLPEIRQQIPGSSKAPRQEPRDILQGSQQEGWICQHCTFLNTNVKSNICEICDKTSFPKAKIQPTVRPKETRLEQSNSDSELKVKPTTKEERRKKNAEYYQKLEAEMLAEKQQAKEAYSGNGRPYPEPIIKEPKTTVEKSKPLSDTDLLELAQQIPSDRFVKLGIELGFSYHELGRLQVRDPTGILGGATFEMLKMWRGDIRGNEQRPKLKQLLENAGLHLLTHVIDENRFIQDEPRVSSPKMKTMRSSTTLPSIMSTSSAPPTPDGVSDEELRELSRMVPLGKIRDLGSNLRLSYLRVQSYLLMQGGDTVDVVFHMLKYWKSRTIRSDQRRELNRILIDCDLGGLTLSEVSSQPKVESRGITDMELYELADSLNAENITQLGVYLGFSMAEISRYQHEAVMESPREGTMRMLQDWKNHQPEKGQRDILSNVLDQIGCSHLGAAIRNPTGFTGHHDNFEESLHQRPLSHATSFGDLSYVKDEEKMRYEEMSIASLKRIAELREAESQDIPVERIKCALYVMEENGEDMTNPIEWIAHNWTDVIQELAHKATQELRENLEVDVDAKITELVQVSPEFAEKCLEDCSGDMPEAVKECTHRAQEKILEIKEIGCYSVEDIVAVLKQDDVQGDAEKALEALQIKAMAEYVDRVWTPTTNGDDNEYFQQAIKIDDRSIRMLMVEYNMRSWGRAQTAAKLIVRNEFDVDDVVIAAEECGDLRRSEVFLKQECSVCFLELPRNKLMSLINCQCMMCRDCVIAHFEIIGKDKSIMKGKCPSCDQPDLDDPAVAADYFAFLDILLREMLTPEVYELFQRKLRDWNLMQDENFCWCAHCNSGFINGAPDRRKMRCPECNKLTCFNCKKQWMDQHEGISCEAFQQWKENNDPDLQAQGLAAHLNENGIECPRCKMRYELAKGGCMHFKCPQCTFEFCCGCNEPMKKEACTRFESCRRKGLHAHHPRDCLFYLRDEDITFLQKLLDDANVEYNKEPPEGAEENEEGVCGVKEQKDGPNGLEDDKCGRKVTPGNAGLCRIHYIEYLVGLINSKKIDPAKSFRINQLEAILTREEIPIPVRRPGEADPDYRKRLFAEVQTKLPLKKSTRDRAR